MERQQLGSAVGTRIASRRRQRGLSRRALAELVGRSEEWLRQIENGSRHLNNLSAALRLARVLHIEDLTELVEDATRAHPPAANTGALLLDLRRAVLDHVSIAAYGPPSAPYSAVPAITATLDDLWETWWYSSARYSELCSLLPPFLAQLRSTARNPGPETTLVQAVVSAYHLTRSVLCRLREPRLGIVAADRGMVAAERSAPWLISAAARNLAMAYLQSDDPSTALDLATAAAGQISKQPPQDQADLLMWGSLQTVAAKAAARLYEPRRATDLLQRVSDAATALGEDRHHHHVWFGPSDSHLTAMQVALRLGRLDEVLGRADRAEPGPKWPPNLATARLVMLGYCYARRRESPAAVLTLLRLERICPEEIRYTPLVTTTLQLLLRHNHSASRAEVGRLARLAGLL